MIINLDLKFWGKLMKIYTYNIDNEEIEILERDNLDKNIIIVDDDEVKFEINQSFTRQRMLELLKTNIKFKNPKNDSKKLMYNMYSRNGKNIQNVKIPKEVIAELIHTLGLIRLIRLKNQVYTVEGFLKEINKDLDKNVIFKTQDIYRMLEDGHLVIINNIYDYPKIKLWEHQDENKLIII